MNTHTLSSSKHSNTIHMHRVKQGLFQLCKSSLQSWKRKRNATATQVHDNLSSAAYSPLLDHHRCQVSFLGLSPCCPRRPETPTALWSPWQQHHSRPHQSHVRSTGTVCMVLITAYHNPSQQGPSAWSSSQPTTILLNRDRLHGPHHSLPQSFSTRNHAVSLMIGE